jgi:predicted RNA-binding Zn ribbon-like protein
MDTRSPRVTGQVSFDSHLDSLLDVAARLVNALTEGHGHGRPYEPPVDPRAAVADALAGQDRSRPRMTDETAAAFADLASALRVVFDDPGGEPSARTINRLLRDTGARPQLDPAAGGGWSVHFHGSDDTLATGWAAGCAVALALAVGSDLAGRLGVCQAERCDRVYVDRSRNGTKRFCSTACQNRVKAAAFRARHP